MALDNAPDAAEYYEVLRLLDDLFQLLDAQIELRYIVVLSDFVGTAGPGCRQRLFQVRGDVGELRTATVVHISSVVFASCVVQLCRRWRCARLRCSVTETLHK
ncbi:hypothetical protein ACIRRA_37820 [Nocardia sp. NPDC101769]|uniref:hypothetical protein n=1 Tax=Nocardia sp. NPDC101769 TaxID=3364333 RepID=UPI00380ADBCD